MRFSFVTALAITLPRVLAQSSTVGLYSLQTTIPWVPQPASSDDQSTVYNDTYYLSDRTNAGVHVISLKNYSQITLVGGFVTTIVNGSVYNLESGPNGMVVLPDRNELWAGDGNGVVKVISLPDYTVVANISTGSVKRADEMAYDASRGIVMVTNPAEDIPYVSVISAANRTVLGKIMFPNVTELEQPAYNPSNGLFYVSVPSSDTYPGGSIATVNITTMSIVTFYPLPNCVPAGIAFGPNNTNIFVGCSQDQILTYNYASSFIISSLDGSLVANVSGISGIDQVTYDPVLNLYYASAYQMQVNGSATGAPMPLLGIVNASSNALIQTIPTDNITAHSVAYDVNTGSVVVPVKAKGIEVFSLSAASANGSSSGSPSGSGTPRGSSTASASGAVSTKSAAVATHSPWSSLAVLVVVLGVSLVAFVA